MLSNLCNYTNHNQSLSPSLKAKIMIVGEDHQDDGKVQQEPEVKTVDELFVGSWDVGGGLLLLLSSIPAPEVVTCQWPNVKVSSYYKPASPPPPASLQ